MRAFAAKSRFVPGLAPLKGTHRFARTPAVRNLLRAERPQAKLQVGAVNDPAEREAERVAAAVMRMPEPGTGAHPQTTVNDNSTPPRVHRLCAACDAQPAELLTVRALCAECAEGLQAHAESGAALALPRDFKADFTPLGHSGRLMPTRERTFFEQRFGRDVSTVRLYAGPAANALAQSVDAHAFTLGGAIVFASSQYAPGTSPSRALLARELNNVVRQGIMPRPDLQPQGPNLQRLQERAPRVQRLGTEPSRGCPVCTSRDERSWVQAKTGGVTTRRPAGRKAPTIVHDVLRSPGQPLEPVDLAFFEPRFGRNFSHVRVHVDARAADSARSVGARAYTVGKHIVFGTAQYRPRSHTGRSLLAHELAHTIQQGAVGPALSALNIQSLERDNVGDGHEMGERTEACSLYQLDSERVQGFWVTEEPAGGCGICYDVLYPGQGPKEAGKVAHKIVEAAFKTVLAPLGLIEFPFSSPEDENGRLDLAVATPRGFQIAEIKPSTPNGKAQGKRDLSFYLQQMRITYPTYSIKLIDDIRIPSGLIMPDLLALANGCPTQGLAAMLMEPGLFGYFCAPPFSQARSVCSCGTVAPVMEKASEEQKQQVTSLLAGIPLSIVATMSVVLAAIIVTCIASGVCEIALILEAAGTAAGWTIVHLLRLLGFVATI
jgi:hypothetical protein